MENIDTSTLFQNTTFEQKMAIYRKLWHRSGNFEILTKFPLHLDIELSGICNLKCASCFQNGLLESRLGLMHFDTYKQIIDEGSKKGLSAVKLQVRGESFLHPQLMDCIDYAKKMGILDVQITTNGTLLTPETIQRILATKLDAIIFSVDAHHGDSILKKRIGSGKNPIEANIDQLLKLRSESGREKPWVRIKTSIPEADRRSFDWQKQRLNKRFPLADIFIVGQLYNFRNDVDAFPDLHESYHLGPCAYLTQRMAIFWNGDVTVCCMDYNGEFDLGNFPHNTIEEIWRSEKLQRLRTMHLSGYRSRMPICRHCHACVTPKQTIRTIVDDTPRHMADLKMKRRP